MNIQFWDTNEFRIRTIRNKNLYDKAETQLKCAIINAGIKFGYIIINPGTRSGKMVINTRTQLGLNKSSIFNFVTQFECTERKVCLMNNDIYLRF